MVAQRPTDKITGAILDKDEWNYIVDFFDGTGVGSANLIWTFPSGSGISIGSGGTELFAVDGNGVRGSGISVSAANIGSENFVPALDDTYDIGSPTKLWKDISVSGSFIGATGSFTDEISVKDLTGDTLTATSSVISASGSFSDQIDVQDINATGSIFTETNRYVRYANGSFSGSDLNGADGGTNRVLIVPGSLYDDNLVIVNGRILHPVDEYSFTANGSVTFLGPMDDNSFIRVLR